MRGQRQSLHRNPFRATCEVLLGLLVALAGMFSAGFVASGILVLFGASWWEGLLVTLAAVLVLIWCATTSWRLITGSPRNDGGLLSPIVIASAGTALAALGVVALAVHGWPAVARAGLYMASGISTVKLARNRFLRRRGRVEQLPSERRHPATAEHASGRG
jgi:hypothetical protein